MDSTTLIKIASEIEPLAQHIDYLHKIIKPSVDIDLISVPATPYCSRFGGNPFVPKDFRLPKHEIGEYRFLGQINFSEIANPPSMLPKSGLLSLFYAYDKEGEIFWGDDNYVIGFYWDSWQDFLAIQRSTQSPKTQRIKLTSSLNLSRHEELRNDWAFNPDLLYELFEKIEANEEYLLGYPSFNTLAYDPTPGSEWISLLTIGSLEQFDWRWHDGDKLMVFIEIDRLRNQDFTNLRSDAG